ncbi:hypothetical protein [Streptomyces sp. CAU 1734]|uniref:hypothetical protein n=1 Tax=Streptomyces sp. CAU 1734 TaxID=3140360 RepID=UPI003260E75E
MELSSSEVLRHLSDDTSTVESNIRTLRTAISLLRELRSAGTVHNAIGFHSDDSLGVSVSLFSLTVAATPARAPGFAAAQCVLAQTGSPLWSSNSGRLLTHPSGASMTLVSGTLAPRPRASLATAGITSAPCAVFQARLTMPSPTREHIAVADLTSAATGHAEAYTSILEGIARTMSFSDPENSPEPVRRTSRIRELFS